jgi:toxin ParE1/3/4
MSPPRLILRPEFARDFASIIDYFAEQSPQAAARFADAVPKALEDVLRFPGAGSLRNVDEDLGDVRSWRVRGFKKYLILYKQTDEGAVVLGLMHGARDISSILRGRN